MNWHGYYNVPVGPAWSDERVPDSVYHMVYGRWRLTPDLVRVRGIHALVRSKRPEDMMPDKGGDAWVSVGSRENPIQYRRVGLNEQGHSKWFNVSTLDKYFTLDRTILQAQGTLVVVEDIPSVLWLASLTGGSYYFMALGGTSLDVNKCPDEGYSKVLVWLDNDSFEIKKKAISIAAQLGAHYGAASRVIPLDDPKDFNPYKDDINKVLTT